MSGQHQFHLADPGGEIRYSIRTGTWVKYVRLRVSLHEAPVSSARTGRIYYAFRITGWKSQFFMYERT